MLINAPIEMFSLEGGQAAASRLLERGVTGIVCAGDPLALGAVRAARRRGLGVPSDISVVGYADSAFMNCTEPPLTTIRRPIEAMGRAAVELLCAGIRGGSLPPDELLFEPELVVRGSTAQAPRRVRTAGPSAAVGARQDRGARAAAAQWGTWTTSTHSPRNI